MAPSRFKKDPREKREVTPFNDENAVASNLAPPEIPAEWRDIEAPVNFTWVVQDELAGMGWPKSRDQVSFLIRQGIDHLITLAHDKIPPHYAFPELKWTMIPVEDFTGPAIGDIKKFIQIMAEARRNGEAVGVHCAEGRGRTGVICACYLIYYYDMEPWDAIRIMRRQRPGSVERKVQEETVVMFYDLLNDDYGCLDNLEYKEKEYKRLKQQSQLKQPDNIICSYTALLSGPVNRRVKSRDQQERMRRARSMPKINGDVDESIKEEARFRQHFEDFFQQESNKRRTSRERSRPPLDKSQKEEENLSEQGRFDRGTTPGRLINNLKPAPRKSEVEALNRVHKCDLKQHFKEFMSTTNTMKRARSFSQPRDKNSSEREIKPKLKGIIQGAAGEQEEKCVEDVAETEKTVSLRPSRSLSRGESKPASDSSGSERASTASTEETETEEDDYFDKPVPDERDNKEADSTLEAKPPLAPPKYKPSLESSTSSYYARVRTRAEMTRRSASGKDSMASGVEDPICSAPSSATVSRKFDANARKYRSKTIEVGFPFKQEPDDLEADKEVETILKADEFEVKSSSRITSSPLKSNNISSPMRPPTASDTLKVNEAQSESKSSRLSPFNRFRTSLVLGSNRTESPRKSSASTEAMMALQAFSTASSGRQRTESESKSPAKSRFFYRKSRTGPLPGDSSEAVNSSSVNSSASNSTHNLGASKPLTMSQEEVSLKKTAAAAAVGADSRHGVRAKSEFSPRTASTSSEATSSDYASGSSSSTGQHKDNLFMAAARKWASYDKPSYQTPFTRDNWKRSHRKFNYSRFLSYTRETFV